MPEPPIPIYDRGGITLYCGGAAKIVPALVDRGVTVLLTDPPHWWRHDVVEREAGVKPFDREAQLEWQRRAEGLATSWLAMSLHLIGDRGSAWVFTHPCLLPGLASAVYRLPERHAPRWPWQRLWVKGDECALVLLGTRGVTDQVIAVIGQIFTAEPYQPPHQPEPLLDLILALTHPNDVILDPFCGSGSFLLAARRVGRRAIGIEVDDDLAAQAVSALQATE